MDTSRRHNSPPADRFLGFFSSAPENLTPTPAADDISVVELREDEVLWTGADHSAPPPSAALSPSSSSSRWFRNLSGKSPGILAALSEQAAGGPTFPHRSTYMLSASPSPSSSARTIPKPTLVDYSVPNQSAPVSVPAAPGRRLRGGPPAEESDGDDDDDDEVLPPHEIAARKGAPATAFSVLEGAGRTLKGRDLRRVRNAVLRQTGFLDLN